MSGFYVSQNANLENGELNDKKTPILSGVMPGEEKKKKHNSSNPSTKYEVPKNSHLRYSQRPRNDDMPTRALPAIALMRQLDAHLAALVAFFDGEAKAVVGSAVVEGVVADEVGEF